MSPKAFDPPAQVTGLSPGADLPERPSTSELSLIPRLLLKPNEAAAALRISPRLLWSKTKLGEIPCLHIGKAVRYSPAALQEWIAKRKGGAP